MTTPLEVLNHRLTLVIGIFALFGILIGYAGKPPYASASDVHDLTSMIYENRVDELEYKIDEIERRMANLKLMAETDRPEWVKNELRQLSNRKERYIRKLDRLLGEE